MLGADLFLRLEGDGVAQSLQPTHGPFDDALPIQRLKIGGPEIVVGLLTVAKFIIYCILFLSFLIL